MMRSIVVAALFLSGCASQVAVRDLSTYRNEVKFLAAASTQEADAIEALMPIACKCEEQDGEKYWLTQECENAADLVQTVRARVPYHVAMMLYLGGDTEERPPKDPPEIPKATDLCQ